MITVLAIVGLAVLCFVGWRLVSWLFGTPEVIYPPVIAMPEPYMSPYTTRYAPQPVIVVQEPIYDPLAIVEAEFLASAAATVVEDVVGLGAYAVNSVVEGVASYDATPVDDTDYSTPTYDTGSSDDC